MRIVALQSVWRSALLGLCFVACTYPYDRTAELGNGEIYLSPVRELGGAPALAAMVEVNGKGRVASRLATPGPAGTSLGDVVINNAMPGRYFLRVTEDEDGNGVADRGAWVTTAIELKAVPQNLTDGCTGTPPLVPTSAIVGEVLLNPTGSISGAVTLDAPLAGTRQRVVVWRTLEGFATPVEAAAGVAADGTFLVEGIIAGEAQIAVFVFNEVTGVEHPVLFQVQSVSVVGGADVSVTLVADQEAQVASGDPRVTGAQIEGIWSLPDPAQVEIPQVFFTAAHDGEALGQDTNGFLLSEQQTSIVVDLPIGVIDVLVSTNTTGASDGILRGVVAVPDGGLQGPVELPPLIASCDVTSVIDGRVFRDCDNDGLEGIPPADGPDAVALHAGCASACASAFGAAATKTTCTVGGTFDCDDDADGQPDVTEPVTCSGPGLGTDLDADDLCEPAEDPFPFCTTNDPAACPTPFSPPTSRH